jgi:hypothetical protein
MEAAGRINDAETHERMAEIMPLEAWREYYDCLMTGQLFFNNIIKYGKIDASLAIPAVRAAAANPDLALHHLLCVNSLNWRLSPTPNAGAMLAFMDVWQDPAGPHDWTPVKAPLSDALARFFRNELEWTTEGPVRFAIFWRPASILLVLAIAAAASVATGARAVILLAAAPIYLNALSLVPLIPSQDYRYQLPATFGGLLLIFFFSQFYLWNSTREDSGKRELVTAEPSR